MPEIDELRKTIAEIDCEIIRKIGERCKIAEQIGALKIAEGLAITAPAVEAAVVERYVREGTARGLSGEFCRKLARLVIDEAVLHQEKLRE